MSDQARAVAFDDSAPQAERTEALAELQKAAMPTQVFSPEIVAQMIEFDEMTKAISHNVVPFPGKHQGDPGMQSVRLDDWQLGLQGEYWEKPAALNFDALRSMVEQTPVLNAVIMTRIRQVQRFCRVQESGSGLGFTVRHVERDHQITPDEKESIDSLNRFITNCGWEFNPRARKKLRRDSFAGMMAKLTRDSLTMDSCAIETEMKRDRKLGIDGITAVDGATIRLCPETGYKDDPDIFALQVIQGRIRTAYTFDDLIYEPRNPRSDVLLAGYGQGETELLIRVVTGFLNAMTYNISGFDKNAIPKGVLHLSGDYSTADLTAFRRYWNSMVKGANSQWTVPVLVSKDQESKASFENFGIEFNEMYFSKWMTFLTSIICAIYGMSPSEINFDSFTGGTTSALSGSDTEEKLADSKDKGLRPLLSYFENTFTDYIITDYSDKYVFRWTGLDEEDAQIKEARAQLILSLDEMRAEEGRDARGDALGDAPLNPALIGPWLQMQQAAQQPGPDVGEPGKPQEEGFGHADDGGDFGQAQDGGDDDGGDPGDSAGNPAAAADEPGKPDQVGEQDEDAQPLKKAVEPDVESVAPLMKANVYGVGLDDHVFYQHAQHGTGSGRVLSVGNDGFTVEHEAGPAVVLWDGFLGHKKRSNRNYRVVDQGDDGAIVEDVLTGDKQFLAGEIPEPEGIDQSKEKQS